MPDVSTTTQPRGFVIDRKDGRPQLPGSLHSNRRLSQWLGFDEPGVVQVYTGKVELGQGILTALLLIVAEELDVPLESVRIRSASTAYGPDEGVTSGSLSVQDSGGALRQACAEVRAMALQHAAALAGQSADTIEVLAGRFRSAQGQDLGDYAALLEGVDLDIESPGTARPKAVGQRRLLGQARPERIDLADKVFGTARFIQDLRLPGMRHGRVLRPPTLDATLARSPAQGIAALPPGVRCWIDGRFIAIVAATEREADAAAARLASQIEWQAGAPLPEAHALDAFLRTAPHETTMTAERGAAIWPADGLQLQAVYLKPYLAHASIGTSCALALWDGRRLEVWTHSQGIHNLRDDLVKALTREATPVAKENIVVHHVEGSGCYGHNGADDAAFDAVLMALRCPGQPVRVLWSRADELTHSPLGAAHRVALRARLDASGRLSHWQHELWANGYSSRPGRATLPALLAASERAEATALPLPINPPLAAGGGAERNAVPAYAVPNLQVIHHRLTVMPLRTSAMRALGAYANVFAIESFVDELARQLGEDPLAFRQRHLEDPRALAVLDTVVQRSTWWGQREQEPEGTGYGLAWARYKNTGAWCAVIARVRVDEQVRVLNLDLAVDVGMVVDLDGVINQIEGGAVQSVSWTTKEQVTFDREAITSNEWLTYPVLRFSEVPELRVHVIDRPEEPPVGAGEAAQGPVAAALANAVFDALGVRVRELPLTGDTLLRAVHAAEAA
ncbi:MAG: xanthine dehydrogenase family protein molybdopterin-binding subunit [Burkholderiales bacterium]|nr:xanthine dehydrogenase family protein molybdopterin-binding subunit [Burkholderiales bacterium]